ncbi:unnamed protein product, partial [Polarella glacialis]
DRFLPTYVLVDLWCRTRLFATPDEMYEDKYIFIAQAMQMRTWMFHQLAKMPEEMAGLHFEGEAAMVQEVLSQSCVDAPVRNGAWSPIISMIPMLLFLALTGDQILTATALIVLALMTY